MRNREKVLNLISWLIPITICMIVIIPVIIYAGLSVPSVDDYSDSLAVINYIKEGNGYLKSAFLGCSNYYYEWGGNMLSLFIDYAIAPITRFGINGVRYVNVLVKIVFYLVLFITVKELTSRIVGVQGSKNALVIYSIIVLSLENVTINLEVYTWYTVAACYFLPFIVHMLMVVCLLKGGRVAPIMCTILAFFASMAPLNIALYNFAVILIFALLRYADHKTKITLFPLASSFAGLLITGLAPGNFNRMNGTGSFISSALKAVVDTIGVMCRYYWKMISGTPFAAFLVIVFLLCFYLRRIHVECKVEYRHPFWALIAYFFLVFCIDYPVCLGYGSMGLSLRCEYFQAIVMIVGAVVLTGYYAGYLCQISDLEFSKKDVFIVGYVSATFFLAQFNTKGVTGWTTTLMIRDLIHGYAQEYFCYETGILNAIKESTDRDVVVVVDEVLDNSIIKAIGITEDITKAENTWLAEYYDKDSVRVRYAEQRNLD